MKNSTELLPTLLPILTSILTIFGSWLVARYTSRVDNDKNMKVMEHKIEEINIKSKLEDKRTANMLLLKKGSELSALLPELMRKELKLGIHELSVYYKQPDEQSKKIALEAIRQDGNTMALLQKDCSILFVYFPDLRQEYSAIMTRFNHIKIYELLYQYEKLMGHVNEYSEQALSGDQFIAKADSCWNDLFDIVERLDSLLAGIVIEMTEV